MAVEYRNTGEVMTVWSQSKSTGPRASLSLAKPGSPFVSVRKASCRSL